MKCKSSAREKVLRGAFFETNYLVSLKMVRKINRTRGPQ